MSRLTGKTAVVTGGGTGIGLGAAKRFVEEGAFVYIFGRRQAQLDAALEELGPNARAVAGSVTSLADLDRLYEAVRAERGQVDIVFANAGTGAFAPLGEITPEHYDAAFDVNVKGLIFTVQKGLPRMRAGGSIILTGSTTGEMGGASVVSLSSHVIRPISASTVQNRMSTLALPSRCQGCMPDSSPWKLTPAIVSPNAFTSMPASMMKMK